jgi:hypothetical protein
MRGRREGGQNSKQRQGLIAATRSNNIFLFQWLRSLQQVLVVIHKV